MTMSANSATALRAELTLRHRKPHTLAAARGTALPTLIFSEMCAKDKGRFVEVNA